MGLYNNRLRMIIIINDDDNANKLIELMNLNKNDLFSIMMFYMNNTVIDY